MSDKRLPIPSTLQAPHRMVPRESVEHLSLLPLAPGVVPGFPDHQVFGTPIIGIRVTRQDLHPQLVGAQPVYGVPELEALARRPGGLLHVGLHHGHLGALAGLAGSFVEGVASCMARKNEK